MIMLAPEIWSICSTAKHCRSNKKKVQTLNPLKTLNSIHYNHSIVAITPDDVNISSLTSLETDGIYYRVVDFMAFELFTETFINYFLNAGSICMISDGTKLDVDNCCCILPNGFIIFKIRREIYVKLGIEGKPSMFACTQNPDFYVIRIDLKKLQHHPNFRKKCSKYRASFTECNLKFNCLMSWTPDDESKCPSSVALYFSKLGYIVNSCYPCTEDWQERDVKFPLLEQMEPNELQEWVAARILKINLSVSNTDYDLVKNVRIFKITGFFSAKKIVEIYSELRKQVLNEHRIPYIVLYGQGFDDVPVAHGLREHNYFSNGDNGFLSFLQPNGLCSLYEFYSCNKKVKSKHF